jgi:hypothetical protein
MIKNNSNIKNSLIFILDTIETHLFLCSALLGTSHLVQNSYILLSLTPQN